MPDFDPQVCTQTLTSEGHTPVCPSQHCQDFQETSIYHDNCIAERMYAPVQSMGCYNTATGAWYFTDPADIGLACLQKISQDPAWQIRNCYCCCACFANHTPVALPGGAVAAIATLGIGDQVLAGTPAGGTLTWAPATVTFSMGTEGGDEPAMVFLVYGDDNQTLVASPDQVFMLKGGALTTAGRLVPGQALVDAEGNGVPVKTVSMGHYHGGVHHISTGSNTFAGSVDGHLILAGGVVAGDYVLQLHFPNLGEEVKVQGYARLPLVGTEAYAQTHAQVRRVGNTHIYTHTELAGENPAIASEVFSAYTIEAQIPYGAQAWLTPDQAADIQQYGKQRPVINRAGYDNAVAAAELLHGFYPDIRFYVDWAMTEPNVWAFRQYGENVVVFSGGLARMDGFFYEGIAMAMAQGAARFLGGEPQDAMGLSCTGQADLYAFGVISQKIWFGNAWIGQVFPAFQQINTLFGFITGPNRGGNPRDVCGDPSIDCRLGAMQAGMGGGHLPPCAGGPVTPPLKLQAAQGDAAGVTLTFSQGVEAEGAEDPANYTLTPAAAITAATRDPDRDFVVVLKAELKPGDYHVDAKGLVSIYGTRLDPDPAGADFKVA